MNLVRWILEQRKNNNKNGTQKGVLFLCLGSEKVMTIISCFFEIVVPQILEYFKENKEKIPNYLILEVLKKDKQYKDNIGK